MDENQYYEAAYNLGLNDDKEEKASLLKHLDDRKAEFLERSSDLKSSVATIAKETKEVSESIKVVIKDLESYSEKYRKEYIQNTDNLLITHSVNWSESSGPKSVSFNLLPALLFVAVGSFAFLAAILIPDYFVASLMQAEINSTWLIIFIKILIFGAVGTLIYVINVKFIASRKYEGKPMLYYYSFLAFVLVLWVVSVSLELDKLAVALLLFLGLNAVTLLPIGLSIVSYHLGKRKLLDKAKKKATKHLNVINSYTEELRKVKFDDLLKTEQVYNEIRRQKDQIIIGFLAGKAEKNKNEISNKEREKKEQRRSRIRKELDIS